MQNRSISSSSSIGTAVTGSSPLIGWIRWGGGAGADCLVSWKARSRNSWNSWSKASPSSTEMSPVLTRRSM